MNEQQFEVETGLTVKTCPECGVFYAMPKRMVQERRENHKTFYCPNGCNLHYPQESDLEKAERKAREAQAETERLRQCVDHKKGTIRMKEYQVRHFKGEVTKLKKKMLTEK